MKQLLVWLLLTLAPFESGFANQSCRGLWLEPNDAFSFTSDEELLAIARHYFPLEAWRMTVPQDDPHFYFSGNESHHEELQKKFELLYTQVKPPRQPFARILVLGAPYKKKLDPHAAQVLDELLTRIPTVLVGYSGAYEPFRIAHENWLNGSPARDATEKRYFAFFDKCLKIKSPWAQALVKQVTQYRDARDTQRVYIVDDASAGGVIQRDSRKLSWRPTLVRYSPFAGMLTYFTYPLLVSPLASVSAMSNYYLAGGFFLTVVAGIGLDRRTTTRRVRTTHEQQTNKLVESVLGLRNSFLNWYQQNPSNHIPDTLLILVNDYESPQKLREKLTHLHPEMW